LLLVLLLLLQHSLFKCQNGIGTSPCFWIIIDLIHIDIGIDWYSTDICVCRGDAAQRVNKVLVYVKCNSQQNPDCFLAVAKIIVQLLLNSDDNSKVTKPLIQVHFCHHTVLANEPGDSEAI